MHASALTGTFVLLLFSVIQKHLGCNDLSTDAATRQRSKHDFSLLRYISTKMHYKLSRTNATDKSTLHKLSKDVIVGLYYGNI